MKRNMFTLLLIFFLASAFAGLAQVRTPTLRDEVRKKGSAWHTSLAHYPRTLASFEDLITRSDLILRGRVMNEEVRLSPSEDRLLTDYTIEVLEVFKDPQHLANVGGRLVVTKGGGNLLLEGKPVRVDTPWFPPIPWIAPHIFFITRWKGDDAPGNYYFTGVQLGVFRIEKGKAIAHSHRKIRHPIIDEFHNKSEDEFIRALKEKIGALKEPNSSP